MSDNRGIHGTLALVAFLLIGALTNTAQPPTSILKLQRWWYSTSASFESGFLTVMRWTLVVLVAVFALYLVYEIVAAAFRLYNRIAGLEFRVRDLEQRLDDVAQTASNGDYYGHVAYKEMEKFGAELTAMQAEAKKAKAESAALVGAAVSEILQVTP